MDPSSLITLINTFPAVAAEAKKKPSQRRPITYPIPYDDSQLDFSKINSLIGYVDNRLRQIVEILGSTGPLDKRLKAFLRSYPQPPPHHQPNFTAYLRDLAEALRIELELEEKSIKIKEQLAKQHQEPLSALSQRLKAVEEARQLYQQERTKLIKSLKPALNTAWKSTNASLSNILSDLDLSQKQITPIQEELISLPPQLRRQRLLAILKVKDFRDLTPEMANKVDQLINQTALLARLQNTAINQIFLTEVQEDLATNAIMLLPLDLIRNKRTLTPLLKTLTSKTAIAGLLPREEITRQLVKLASEGKISLPPNYQGLVDQIVEMTTSKMPTQAMLIEPLAQIVAGYQSREQAKAELKDQLTQAAIPGLADHSAGYLDRMIDMAIEESLITAHQLSQYTEIGDLETQVAQGVRQILARHNVSLPERQLREIFKKITYRIETSPTGVGIKKAIAQAVDETTDEVPQLDQVIKPDGTRLSTVLTSQLEKSVHVTSQEIDYLSLAQSSLAKILAEYDGYLNSKQRQTLIKAISQHLQSLKPGTNIEEAIRESIDKAFKDLMRTDPAIQGVLEKTNPSGKKFIDEFTEQLNQSLKLTQADKLPADQRSLAIATAVKSSLDFGLYQIALRDSQAIIGNQLLIKTPSFIAYLREETDAGELFRRNLLINLNKKRSAILEGIAAQLTKRDENLSPLTRFFKGKAGKAAGIFTAALMLLGKLAPELVEGYGEQADIEEQNQQAIEQARQAEEKKQLEIGLAIPVGLLALYLNRKKILLYLRQRFPLLRKFIALRRLKRWQALASAKQAPASTPIRLLAKLRFFKLKEKLSLGSVFLAGLQTRFPRLFPEGNFILSRQGLTNLIAGFTKPDGFLFRYLNLLRTLRNRFSGLLLRGFSKGLLPIITSFLRISLGTFFSLLGPLGRFFSPILSSLTSGQFSQLVSLEFNQMKKWVYILAVIVIFFFIVILPHQQIVTQTAFVAPVEGVATKEEFEEEFPIKPGGIPDFSSRDRLVPCDESKEITVPGTEKHLFTGLGKTGRCITPEIIVIHWSAGTRGNQGTYDYLNSHENGYSCQFAIDSKGTWQMLQLYEDTVEYGRCTGGIDPNTGYSYNSLSINIEMDGVDFDTNPPPETEIAETIRVTCWLLNKYIVPQFGQDSFNKIFGHFQLTPGKRDPGKTFFENFKKRLIKECSIE